MPHIKIDEQGRFYESDPDKCDGSGYKGHAPRVRSNTDVTYGSPHLKHEQAYKQAVLKNRRSLGVADQREAGLHAIEKRRRAQKRQKEEIKRRMLRQPHVQRELVKRGIGCACPVATMAARPSDIQKAINHHVTGRGTDTSISISDGERKRQAMKAHAERILIDKAAVKYAKEWQQSLKEKQAKALDKIKERKFNEMHGSKPIGETYQPRRRRPLLKKVEPIILHPLQLMRK